MSATRFRMTGLRSRACLLLLVLGCRDGESSRRGAPSPASNSPAPKEEVTGSLSRQGSSWRSCQADSDCGEAGVCIAVDAQSEQARLLAPRLSSRACASVVSGASPLENGPDFKQRYLNRLLLFPSVGLRLSMPRCTLLACARSDGTQAPCCNRCGGEQAWLPGFVGVPMVLPDGRRVECEERLDCEPAKCPSWVDPKLKFEVAGAFLLTKDALTFQLAATPKPVTNP